MDRETKPSDMQYRRNTFNYKRNSHIKNQRLETIIHAMEAKKKAGVAILMSEKVDSHQN